MSVNLVSGRGGKFSAGANKRWNAPTNAIYWAKGGGWVQSGRVGGEGFTEGKPLCSENIFHLTTLLLDR